MKSQKRIKFVASFIVAMLIGVVLYFSLKENFQTCPTKPTSMCVQTCARQGRVADKCSQFCDPGQKTGTGCGGKCQCCCGDRIETVKSMCYCADPKLFNQCPNNENCFNFNEVLGNKDSLDYGATDALAKFFCNYWKRNADRIEYKRDNRGTMLSRECVKPYKTRYKAPLPDGVREATRDAFGKQLRDSVTSLGREWKELF